MLVSFAFFSGGTPGQSLGFLKMMFGVGGFATLESSKSVLYLLASHYLVLILAAVSSTAVSYTHLCPRAFRARGFR